MKKIIVGVILIVVPVVVWSWPWSQDMMDQPSVKPQEGTMKPFPRRSVPASGFPTKVNNREDSQHLSNPIAVSDESIKTGKQLYTIYCATCHGKTGRLDSSPVSLKMGAISLVDDYVQKELTEGWIYGTITFGGALMPAYGNPTAREDGRGSNDLTPEERWHVVNYVRHAMVNDSASGQVAQEQDKH